MRRRGFTIAEVLVTITIVGIVAAMTIPTLVASYQKKVWATTLSVSVSNLEKAMTTMIVKEGVRDLFRTKAWLDSENTIDAGVDPGEKSSFFHLLNKSFVVTEVYGPAYEFYSAGDPKGYNGVGPVIFSNAEIGFLSTNKAVYFATFYKNPPKYLTEEESVNLNLNLRAKAGNVIIDVNGKTKPNKFGYDLFAFVLGQDGKLYPYGTRELSIFDTETDVNTWDNASSASKCIDGDITYPGWACTARMVENNYVMDY